MEAHSGVGWHIMAFEQFANGKGFGWVCQTIIHDKKLAILEAKKEAKERKGKFLGVEGEDGNFVD